VKNVDYDGALRSVLHGRGGNAVKASPKPSPAKIVVERLQSLLIFCRSECGHTGITACFGALPSLALQFRIDIALDPFLPELISRLHFDPRICFVLAEVGSVAVVSPNVGKKQNAGC